MTGLENSKLFCTLNPADLRALEALCQLRSFTAGEFIFREGDHGDGLYVVIEGEVEISVLVTGDERRVIYRVGPGDFFGEMAVLDGEVRSASATATVATQSAFFERATLLHFVENSPRLAVSLVREFSQRLRDFNRRYIQEVLQAERLSVVGRFARSIVHDFKNPLHIIGLAAEIYEMENISPEMKKNAGNRIRKQVDRLNSMISELLEFTRNPQRQAVFAQHNYAQYVTEVLAELGPEISEKGVEIVVRKPAPDVFLSLDPKRLNHVFSNLLHNAVDAVQGRGTVYLSFELFPDEVITRIQDTGPGIAPEIAARLFEPFATFGKAKGSGLGLSICRKIIEDHRGRIQARNEPGAGAVFEFSLPRPRG